MIQHYKLKKISNSLYELNNFFLKLILQPFSGLSLNARFDFEK